MAVLIDHPCVQHKLAIIRDADTGHKRFRELATEITKFICYEALKNVRTREVLVQNSGRGGDLPQVGHRSGGGSDS